MASYPPPTQNTPIFNPDLFPEQNQPITESNANTKYVQTGTATQVVRGMKRFNDLGFTGTGALQWTQPTSGVFTNFAPNITTFNQTFLLPTYTAPTLDTIVGRTAVQTLTNKTLNSLKVGTNGTTATLVQYGRSTRSGTNPFTLTFPTAFSNTPTVVFNMEINNSSYLFTSQLMSVSTTNFTYRMYLITIANPALCALAGDPHTINWYAYGDA